MRKKLNDKQKKIAYVLSSGDEFNCTMKEIGKILNVSQSTISNAVKEVSHKNELQNSNENLAKTEKELEELKKMIIEKEMVVLEAPFEFSYVFNEKWKDKKK